MFITQAEIIRGDDIDITMAERQILTLGTRTNFLTQLHSSFQVRGISDQIMYGLRLEAGSEFLSI